MHLHQTDLPAAASTAATLAPKPASGPLRLGALRHWFDTQADGVAESEEGKDRIDWLRAVPFILLHAACVAVFWTGVSTAALAVAAVLYAIRMFALTGFYHRYFSHRAFRTSP
jgi:stearoyl-CoA desaturase (delta-9 desaturase)